MNLNLLCKKTFKKAISLESLLAFAYILFTETDTVFIEHLNFVLMSKIRQTKSYLSKKSLAELIALLSFHNIA
jgi:hypothetical protein